MNKSRFTVDVRYFLAYLLVFTIGIFAEIVFSGNSDSRIISILMVLAFSVVFSFNNRKDRYALFLFNITFFIFLLSRMFFEYIDGEVLLAGYSAETKTKVFIYLPISLISLMIGYKVYEIVYSKKSLRDSHNREVDYSSWIFENKHILFVVLALFYVTYPFSLLDVVDKATFVGASSYKAYYTDYVSRLPYVFTKIGGLNSIAIALFLCIEYRKRKIMLPVVLYLITSVLSLGIGQRNIFVLDILMLAVLFRFANTKSVKYTGKPLYAKKHIALVTIAAPVLIVFLGYWKFGRAGDGFDFGDIYAYFKDFFYSQGGQIVFFANTIEIKDRIWTQKVPYTFSAPYNYLRNLFGLLDYGIYTQENAMVGNSLAATQFYITSPGSLVSGVGSGCCYLSELYFDFGLIGIVIGSLLIGYVLATLYLSEERKYYVNAFAALMIRSVIYIPRASYFDWIATPFNIWNVAIVVCVIIASSIVKRHFY